MRALLWLPLLLSTGCHSLYDEPAFPSGPAAEDIELPPSASPSPTTAPRVADDDMPPPATRLRRTKTLGMSDSPDWYSSQAPQAAPAAPGTTIIINNNVSQASGGGGYYGPGYYTGGGYYYGGPSYGRGTGQGPGVAPTSPTNNDHASHGGGSRAPSSPPPVGGDWPRVPSYGPR